MHCFLFIPLLLHWVHALYIHLDRAGRAVPTKKPINGVGISQLTGALELKELYHVNARFFKLLLVVGCFYLINFSSITEWQAEPCSCQR